MTPQITTRVLPRAEWPRLHGTELEAAASLLPADDTVVVVVERDGAIIACWALVRYVHVEGVWIHPAHRGRGRVAGYLLSAMRATARALGVRQVLTAAVSPDVKGLIARLGGDVLPGQHYVIPIQTPEGSCLQQS